MTVVTQGGEHTSNPDFSSTKGLYISLLPFKNLMTVGARNTADEIYKYIQPKGYTVLAGENAVGIRRA
jgi:hypothetical protein